MNGRIWTGDAARPSAQAMAIRADRLVAVGTDSAIRALRGPNTRVVDLTGQRVVPGFIDGHWHLPTSARADLTDAGSPAVIVRRLQEWARTLPPGAWIVGRGWTPSDFPGNAPDKRFLDAAFPDRPVLLTDRDGHQSLVNTVALARASVTRTTADPAQGRIERGADGSPTGLLKEAASGLVSKLVPAPTAADIVQRLNEQTRRAASFGLTMLQEASAREPSGAVFDALEQANTTGGLRVRFYVSVPFNPNATTDALRRYLTVRDAHTGTMLRYGIAKGMLDGTVDAKTAAMLAPYAGTDDTGLPFWPANVLNRGVAKYDSAGLQVELHAIGDKAVRMALDAYQAAARANGTSGRRHRVEHIEVPDAADLPRFKQLGVIASTQAIFASPDETTLNNYAPLLGPARAARSNAFKYFDDAGAVQAFGSDYPVFPMDVLRGIYTAVTRQMPDGTPRGGWYPASRITVEAAVRHYTRDAAYAAFMEKETGTISAGKLADFVVLSKDIFSVPPAELLRTKVMRTVVGGREVFQQVVSPTTPKDP
ncbi:MAG: amidohydrolase [Gemmatimonadaceae bacterium]|nr:amidohydrolase [Gemmatimonadaceae bacterium]